jgi:hypothetical protein
MREARIVRRAGNMEVLDRRVKDDLARTGVLAGDLELSVAGFIDRPGNLE